MTEIHAFDPDGTPSPGAQTALADAIAAIPAATTEQRGLMSADDKAHLDETPARDEVVQKASGAIIAGPDAGGEFPAGFEPTGGSVVALGREAMGSMTDVKTSIAIGKRALGTGDKSRDNIAIGDDALYKTSSLSSDYTQTGTDGTRNIAIGGNAGRHIAHGVGHVAIGRNAGQNVVGGKGLVAIGNGAHASQCPIGLSGQIENWSPAGGTATQAYRVTVVGASAGARIASGDATVLGADALRNAVKSSEVVAVGTDALRNVESGAWLNGMAYTVKNLSGTYVHDVNTLTVTVAGHGAKVGDIALIRLTSGPSETFMGDVAPAEVVSASAGAFVVAHPIARSGTGDALLVGVADAAAAVPDSSQTTAVGAGSLRALLSGRSNVAVGYTAGANLAETGSSTLVGAQAGHGASGATATENTLVGFQAGRNVTSARYNTGVGYRALNALTTGEFNVGVGYNAGRYLVSGAPSQTVTNTSAIGYDARVSGDNQVQLGNSSTTTYVYGTVQNRSDARDKADVRDTELGLDFIEKLRPVDYRWDMRDDYEDGTPDGTRKRERFHHGVIAQEVLALDAGFGGVQDHSLDGGDDVLTVGYDEFVAPLIKAVQELSARVRELEGRFPA